MYVVDICTYVCNYTGKIGYYWKVEKLYWKVEFLEV